LQTRANRNHAAMTGIGDNDSTWWEIGLPIPARAHRIEVEMSDTSTPPESSPVPRVPVTGGVGTAENGHTPVPPQGSGRLVDWFRLDLVGNLVFVAACAALLLAAVLFALSSLFTSNWPDTFALVSGRRVFEVILTVAGLGVFVSMVTRTQNAFVATLGIMVITALILPPREIMRFALLLTGSERRIVDFYETHIASGGATSELRSVEGSALYILQRVQAEVAAATRRPARAASGDEARTEPVEQFRQRHGRIKGIIEDELIRLLAGSAFNRLNAIGAMATLRELESDVRRVDFVQRHQGNERFLLHVALLRHEDAITYVLDRLDTISLTPFGQQIARHDPREQRTLPREGLREALLPEGLRRTSSMPPCGDWELLSMPAAEPALGNPPADPPVVRRVRISGEQSAVFVRFDVDGDADGLDFEFVHRPDAGSGLDPTLMIASFQPSALNAPLQRDRCMIVAQNDDRFPGADLSWAGQEISRYASHLRVRLPPGTYVARLGAFGASAGAGMLLVRRDPTGQPG
jgi:hypothetical protein